MKKIPSFTIDHLRLLRGVYVSRKDTTPSGDIITTFDIRLTEPNRSPALTPESLMAHKQNSEPTRPLFITCCL
ncbi:MAG: S-ribosylhomocysteine lyase, partial [Muribaculaceae bacterium]|nr:S-ribosylhomocysteine lyase [Muribaculaceae bacterium]